MVSPEIKQAKNALIVRRRALRDELNRVEQAIKSLEGVMGGSSMGAPSQPRKRSGGQVKNTIIQILKASGGMTHADDVVKELEARGVELSAADPKATVVTALIRLAKSGEVERMPKNQFRWKRKELVIMPTEGNEEDPDEE